ncbi:hypothetical protein PILCRDRAFT_829221 [Piloderma croceum F 1598]|uniref:Uncharacterized protein n=1 Tax=Piloderma croceum (strain F 1598) TaxID=765440 RepID=A0A0C3EZJ0_PILCF|nr:hypothetical protein PILCRDRAFT_829221 [Piloderma croceum F 1598]
MPLELVQPPTARLVRDAGQIVAVNADNDNGRWGMELLQVVMQNILSVVLESFSRALIISLLMRL